MHAGFDVALEVGAKVHSARCLSNLPVSNKGENAREGLQKHSTAKDVCMCAHTEKRVVSGLHE